MSFIRKLFGVRDAEDTAAEEAVEYNGFKITPQPIKENAGFRVGAEVSKEIDGQVKIHRLVRADVCPDAKTANDLAIQKARQVIDFEGEKLFREG